MERKVIPGMDYANIAAMKKQLQSMAVAGLEPEIATCDPLLQAQQRMFLDFLKVGCQRSNPR